MKIIKKYSKQCIIAFAGIFISHNANADLKVCNDTENTSGVAVGYLENNQWISQGWWHIPAGECSAIVEGNLKHRYYYIFAEDEQTNEIWQGNVSMCTSNVEFKIIGRENCFVKGYEKAAFFEVDTKQNNSWQVRLTEQNKNNGKQN